MKAGKFVLFMLTVAVGIWPGVAAAQNLPFKGGRTVVVTSSEAQKPVSPTAEEKQTPEAAVANGQGQAKSATEVKLKTNTDYWTKEKIDSLKKMSEEDQLTEIRKFVNGEVRNDGNNIIVKDENGQDVFIPKSALPPLLRPTYDGSVRGRVSIESDSNDPNESDENIFLYYDDFRIVRDVTGRTTCEVRFYVLTTLDRKLNELGIKLVWPQISTAVMFSGVNPNEPTYVDYTLMGDGCYSMDKIPNIVVNRCRAKGMSSQECAAKIRWIKASN